MTATRVQRTTIWLARWLMSDAPLFVGSPVKKRAQAAKITMEAGDARKAVIDSGTEVFVTSPAEFSQFIADETKIWSGILKGISIEKQ